MSQLNESATPKADDHDRTRAPKDTAYRAPQVVPVGKATDLLQSYSYGAYEDRYTGYKWNR